MYILAVLLSTKHMRSAYFNVNTLGNGHGLFVDARMKIVHILAKLFEETFQSVILQ